MAIEWILAFLALGCFAGVMAGLLGIGGGGIMVPLLTSIFLAQGIAPEAVVHLALGTSMATIVMTSLSSMRAHHARAGVLWPVVKAMAPGVIVGTFAATFVAARISSLYLAGFFALFMGYVAFTMLRAKTPTAGGKTAGKAELATVGAGIGAVSALVSIGGGSLTVPYLSWRSIDIKKAIGTSAAVGLPISVAGTAGYLLNSQSAAELPFTVGLVYVPAVVLMSAASFVCAPLGAKLAHKLPVATLKRLFGILLLLLSLKMLASLLAH
ncbi:sulfite exporter TauE/SafE family protein [Rheinheimera aquimaris]|uniref:sulfite exporter TauE/SafE family protein n=1 Tax=Rheinheimera aquimaris TaxID=412437 RepID=UPI001E4B95C8|nr:sulfite exporter TauE/SafE family protein [Rheinheimera aquimaris]MCD1598988.1 sulfite exporter TauE/SafE family protein [Rheinheimera aquimaris]